jgi:hypothetical protein
MTLLLDSRVLGFDIVRGSQLIFKTLEKQGLRGEDDKNQVIRHRQLHDPGIHKEPLMIYTSMSAFQDTNGHAGTS